MKYESTMNPIPIYKTDDSYVSPFMEMISIVVDSLLLESNLEPIDNGDEGYINW